MFLLTAAYVYSPPKSVVRVRLSKKYAATGLRGAEQQLNVKLLSARHFPLLVDLARASPRLRKMTDLTKEPSTNSLQVLVNTWTSGSYSPVHRHDDYSEAFVVLHGALAFFTFTEDGSATCRILHDLPGEGAGIGAGSGPEAGAGAVAGTGAGGLGAGAKVGAETMDRAIVVEKGQWHAMTAAPPELGWPGYAVVFETSGHVYDETIPTKTLAPFAPALGDGIDGDPALFVQLLHLCPRRSA
ncbi:hypothetical protein B484DRAFT_402337 [Ochromonadaceae sp. CCMP2298]|nr:hypothetical protein B484DRAFT_402337 [Ochromonadaceae sp. CCMP2298]